MPEARELTPYTDEPRWLWNPARDSITSIKDTSRKDAESVPEGRRRRPGRTKVHTDKGGAAVEGRSGDWGEVVTR